MHLDKSLSMSRHIEPWTSRSLDCPPPCEQGSKSACYTHGLAHVPNDHDVAHPQAKTVPINLIWSAHLQAMAVPTNLISGESTHWLLISDVCQILGALVTPRARPCGPGGHMTMTLHIYRPRQFIWTWFGVNPPSGYWVPASARFQKP